MENFQPQFHINQRVQKGQILITSYELELSRILSTKFIWIHRTLIPGARKGKWPRFPGAFKSLCLLKSVARRHMKCLCESRPNVCSLQPAGHNHFFGECFQLMGFRAVPFTLWCCPLFLPNHDIDEYSHKCIYQQWNVFHTGYIDLNFSGCTNTSEIMYQKRHPDSVWGSYSQPLIQRQAAPMERKMEWVF